MLERPLRRPATRAAVLSACLAALVAATGARAGPRHPGPARTVVLLSIDGLRWDYPARARAGALARMAAEGASASALVPPFPSSTFPAHASLATGVYPDRHGIVNNEFIDRMRGPYRREDDASWLLAEPLWVTAERQGVRTAVYHWVFSYTPWHGVAATRREPFSKEVTDREKIERILAWLALPEAERPRLILSYLHGPDAAGHEEGPDSGAVLERVRRVDRLVGRLMRALDAGPPAALVVVSDHGMAAVDRVLRTRDILGRGPAGRVRAVCTGAVCNIYCPDGSSCAAAREALRRVQGLEVFTGDDLPEAWRCRVPSRTGDLVAIAPRDSYFSDAPREPRPARGMHGFPPEREEMRGIFYARGAGVRRGAHRESLRAVDVAPFVCRLLGIEPPAAIDGRPPADLLEEGGGVSRLGPPPAPRGSAPP